MSSDTIPLIPSISNTKLWSFPVHIWQLTKLNTLHIAIYMYIDYLSLYSSLRHHVESKWLHYQAMEKILPKFCLNTDISITLPQEARTLKITIWIIILLLHIRKCQRQTVNTLAMLYDFTNDTIAIFLPLKQYRHSYIAIAS